jgi:hypothetical protein
MAKKKVTLETLDKKFDDRFTKFDDRFAKLETLMEKGFAAVADDISKLTTKQDVAAVHTQVNSIERQLRDMKYPKLEDRVIAIEQKVFGKVRA